MTDKDNALQQIVQIARAHGIDEDDDFRDRYAMKNPALSLLAPEDGGTLGRNWEEEGSLPSEEEEEEEEEYDEDEDGED